MIYYLVYKTTHIPSGRFYIGRHITDNFEDGYLGSGNIIRRMLSKHTIAQFSREIIRICGSDQEMLELEAEEISKVFNDSSCLNLMIGDPRLGTTAAFSKSTKQRMSESRKQTHNTPETKAKLSAYHKNRPQEVRDKIGAAHHGKTISEEMRKKQSLALSGEKNPRALKWTIEYEDNRPSETVVSLKSWCKEHGIKYTSVYMKVKRGDTSFYNGLRVCLSN